MFICQIISIMRICIDEAGRGPLAWPVHVGLVVEKNYPSLVDYQDSKQLSASRREQLYTQIASQPDIVWAVSSCSAQEIDTHGIVWAIRTAIVKWLDQLFSKEKKADYTLVIDWPSDFGLGKMLGVPCIPIIKGDQKNRCISMASILAKVTRDHMMLALAEKYPQYGFEKHMGYGTANHEAMVKFLAGSGFLNFPET